VRCRVFDTLRDVRGLEYELDFVTNRANRDIQVTTPAVHSKGKVRGPDCISSKVSSVTLQDCVPVLTQNHVLQSLREKATAQIAGLEAEKAQLAAEVAKVKGRALQADHSKRPLANKENIHA
jgi:hypothetical protein